MTKSVSILLTVFLLLISTGKSWPQTAISSKDPAQWALIYSENLDKNRDRLSKYSWQYGVAVMEGSELLYVDILEVTHDSKGQLKTEQMQHDLKIKERSGILSKADR
ncbi:hypothetical protein OAK50_02645 [Verrucomicrobiales bacterium]|jgi:hypothetical protein|nr:hypothetical protein [Verrucomicrobiales bacterium]MDA9924641.1 hypothetical protein [Verrucomicrobiales bacterium]MDB3940231.1 hypothetical protein [Verrucomicrobiales bacterium]MDC0263167.1 hypothetical protein [Verrucomicrobiales bacterium]MDC3352637.1 hypothetical protein [Verrucomicrobiales bacterium]